MLRSGVRSIAFFSSLWMGEWGQYKKIILFYLLLIFAPFYARSCVVLASLLRRCFVVEVPFYPPQLERSKSDSSDIQLIGYCLFCRFGE